MCTSDETTRDALLADIRRTFADVRRGDGVTLHEAEVIDACGSMEERAESRTLDTDEFWWDVPDEDIEHGYAALSFLDPPGLHYYIPAYMSWTVRCGETSPSVTGDSTVFALCPTGNPELRDWVRERLSVFTAEQGAVIGRFIRFMDNRWNGCDEDDDPDDPRWISDTEGFWPT